MIKISEDIGEQIIQELNKLSKIINEIKKQKEEDEKNFPKLKPTVGQKKNSQLHLVLGISLYKNLRKEAAVKEMSMSEYCRCRLRGIF